MTVHARGRLRGELRRCLHPGAGAAVIAIAGIAVYLQAGRAPYAAAPSPGDAVGALRIGLLQHGTLLGASLAAFLAGLSVGEDLTSGTFETWRFSDPRWLRRWLRRLAVLTGFVLGSAVVTAVALRATAGHASGGPSSLPDLAIDGLPALCVIASFAAISLAASLAVRNPMLLLALTVTLFTVPSYAMGAWAQGVLPSGVIARALHLTENGTSVNYLAERSAYLQRSPSQWIALVVLICAATVATGVGATVAERRGRKQRV